MNKENLVEMEKHKTGMPGFEHVSMGGLPKGRTTLVAGTSGSSKTVFATQFLAEGIKQYGESGVFITFEETPEDIRKNMMGFNWPIAQWEAKGKWAFVDASPQPAEEYAIVGEYDLGALLARVEHAVNKVGGSRLVMDSIGAIFSQFTDSAIVRRELFRIVSALKKMEITSLLTAERTKEYGDIARHGVEEFVADNVIILRNVLESEKRRRTMEILKFRGTAHHKGEYPFTIFPGDGITVIPLSDIGLKHQSSNTRVTSGNEELDRMCGGGFFKDSIILISGATGAGKTLTMTEFIAGGNRKGEKSLLFAFEESRGQLFRNARSWGFDFESMEKDGRLKTICAYPEVAGLEEHLVIMKKAIDEFKPSRIAVDSLSALERVSTPKSFREFVIGITAYMKEIETTGLFTSTTPTIMGGSSVTEEHISTITDSIILLRYVEMFGELRRGLMVLKMRGSNHNKEIREFNIDGQGMHIGKQIRNVSGILSGNPANLSPDEIDRMDQMFKEREDISP